uniref:Uncharacterized protein n=1 Tax=Ananas comosus var. bracteatus TaxID=296719 RepID=A0A6V7QY71_ANACO
MSSPARSSASAASAGPGGGGSNAGAGDDGGGSGSTYQFPSDPISALDRKDEALAALRLEVTAALQKEVKSLDEDSWMFTGPRSRINLISKTGGYQLKRAGGQGEMNQQVKQKRSFW